MLYFYSSSFPKSVPHRNGMAQIMNACERRPMQKPTCLTSAQNRDPFWPNEFKPEPTAHFTESNHRVVQFDGGSMALRFNYWPGLDLTPVHCHQHRTILSQTWKRMKVKSFWNFHCPNRCLGVCHTSLKPNISEALLILSQLFVAVILASCSSFYLKLLSMLTIFVPLLHFDNEL